MTNESADDLRDRVAALADDLIGFVRTFETGEAAANALPIFLHAVLAASSAPVVSRPEAEDERRFRDEWADYFEHWTQAVGPKPLTVETVIAILRAEHKPFGVAAASLAEAPEVGDVAVTGPLSGWSYRAAGLLEDPS